MFSLYVVKYRLGTQAEKLENHMRIQKKMKSWEEGRTGKMKRPAKNGFTVLLEANVQISTPRFKHKSMPYRQVRIIASQPFKVISSWLYK